MTDGSRRLTWDNWEYWRWKVRRELRRALAMMWFIPLLQLIAVVKVVVDVGEEISERLSRWIEFDLAPKVAGWIHDQEAP